KKDKKKTYNTGYSLVVTDPTTDPALAGLSRGERTGSRAFQWLWSYVKGLGPIPLFKTWCRPRMVSANVDYTGIIKVQCGSGCPASVLKARYPIHKSGAVDPSCGWKDICSILGPARDARDRYGNVWAGCAGS
ncbi:hypothetical protein GQ53DRAFT_673347, partial [Thozetella sp. PMI_491]